MGRNRHGTAADRSQRLVYGLLSLAVTVLAAVTTVTSPGSFRPYFGSVQPLLVMLVVVALGAVLWDVVLPRRWFVVYEPGAVRSSLPVVVFLPTLLAAGMITVDVLAVLPPDLNVRFPSSLSFYPSIGFVVEIVFHLVPFSVLLLAASTRVQDVERPRLRWGAIVAVAAVEPIFQVGLGVSQSIPLWASAYIGANVLAIGVAQLYLLWQYDFLAMYSFRLVYYLLWHIAWGHVRLQVLF